MNHLFASARTGRACALVLAFMAAPAVAVEPVLPAPDLSAQLQPLLVVPSLKAHAARLSIGGASAEALDLERLDGERGRADTTVNDTRLNGDVANNSAVNVNTGSNTIDAGSFANMSGIPVVIQNSGANVLIQNATVINLQFQ